MSSVTALTEIHVFVNGQEAFKIKNNPETGLSWVIKGDMDRENYIQGLYALVDANYNSAIHSIKTDSERIKNSKNAVDRG